MSTALTSSTAPILTSHIGVPSPTPPAPPPSAPPVLRVSPSSVDIYRQSGNGHVMAPTPPPLSSSSHTASLSPPVNGKKRFGTVTSNWSIGPGGGGGGGRGTGAGKGDRRIRTAIGSGRAFEPPHPSSPNKGAPNGFRPGDSSRSLGSEAASEVWQVRVGERKVKEKGRKIREPTYTVHLTSSTRSLTLARSLKSLSALDAKLRSSLPSHRLPNRPPILNALSSSPSASFYYHRAGISAFGGATATPAPGLGSGSTPPGAGPRRKATRNMLQTLSRTLSPAKRSARSRPSLTALTNSSSTPAVSHKGGDPFIVTGPGSEDEPDDGGDENDDDDDYGFEEVRLSEQEKLSLEQAALEEQASAESQLEAFLSALLADPLVRGSPIWIRFAKVGREDFEGPPAVVAAAAAASVSTSASASAVGASAPSRPSLAIEAGGERKRTRSDTGVGHPIANGTSVAHQQSEKERERQEAEEALGLTADEVKDLDWLARGSEADVSGSGSRLGSGSGLGLEPQGAVAAVEARQDVQAGAEGQRSEGEKAEEECEGSDRGATYTAEPVDVNVPTIIKEGSQPGSFSTQEEAAGSPSQAPSSASRLGKPALASNGHTGGADKRQPRPKSLGVAGKEKTTVADFEIMRVLGKGCAGKVLMVRHRPELNPRRRRLFDSGTALAEASAAGGDSGKVYAMKSIQKGHVLAHRELQHTLTEQSVLKRVTDEESNPFVVRLWWSFHDKDHLFLVMDFHNGGDLATQLARWGRLGRDRARFYAAEIAEGVCGLHAAGVIYRDLKPENILIAADGHIVLTDFGLSKQFPIRTRRGGGGVNGDDDGETEEGAGGRRALIPVDERTTTFCGTAEYLAPEVLLGEPYSYEVDWWSFGTMLYEMLTGLTPFWSEDHATMYRRVLHDELAFDEDSRVMDSDTKTLLRGLLQRNPAVRMTGSRLKRHPYFGMIDWAHVYHKRYIPPYVPSTNPDDATDTQNFDEAFLSMEPTYVQEEEAPPASPGSDGRPEVEPENALDENGRDVFDGYSYLAPRADRDSIVELSDDDDVSARGEYKGHGDGTVEAGEEEEEEKLEIEEDSGAGASPVSGTTGEEDEMNDSYERGNTSSTRTASTRPTSVEREDAHPRQRSGGLDSLTEAEPDDSVGGPGRGQERDEEPEDEWDVVDTPENGMWDRNGKKGNTLFARGVVDKYKLRMRTINVPTSSGANRGLPYMSRQSSMRSSERPSDSEPNSINPSRSSSTRPGEGRFRLAKAKLSNTAMAAMAAAPAPAAATAGAGSWGAKGRAPRPSTPDSARFSERTVGPSNMRSRKSMSDLSPPAKSSGSPRSNNGAGENLGGRTKLKVKKLALGSGLFSSHKNGGPGKPRSTRS